ncbi:hypothetical protein [Burkholderia sp. Se-20378]|uniref:hypothetical protein n=1 Tax=Burkholderia sp. Se-20378 TaxID=2703899 RepID=UPI00197F2940|nr:hypothetical protein [Burkholderia sp. Se-20378]MBN3771287.1 hypothetical protein [Burkholderia sp. Se-20378]
MKKSLILLATLLYSAVIQAQIRGHTAPMMFEPSVCDSDYVAIAKKKFTLALDAVDQATPVVSAEKIKELSDEEDRISEHCPMPQSGVPNVMFCREPIYYKENREAWRALRSTPEYIEWKLHEEVNFLRPVLAEIDRYTSSNIVDARFYGVKGNIWLLTMLGSDFAKLYPPVDPGEPDPMFLNRSKVIGPLQDARDGLFDILRCDANKTATTPQTPH